MLHITGSMKTLKGELELAIGLCKDIIGVLDSVTSDSNLTKKVGTFILKMPDFKVLAKDTETAKQILRKVCSGELSPLDAKLKFEKALKEVTVLLEATKLVSNLN